MVPYFLPFLIKPIKGGMNKIRNEIFSTTFPGNPARIDPELSTMNHTINESKTYLTNSTFPFEIGPVIRKYIKVAQPIITPPKTALTAKVSS